MSIDGENVTLPGSDLVFHNTYGVGVSEAYRNAIISAENELQSHFSNAITVNMQFDLQPLAAGFNAQNSYYVTGVSYADFVSALATHATTANDALAVAGLPQADPSHGVGFWIPTAEARLLGLTHDLKPFDALVTLNSDQAITFGKDTVSTLEHEITEGVFGRVSSLGVALQGWQPMDLFRFDASGQRDFTGGADGKTAYFGLDGQHLSDLSFHNAVNADGSGDGAALADWNTSADAFGPGAPGIVGELSQTDLQVLDILGWTPTAPHAAPAPAAVAVVHDLEPPVMTSVWGGAWVDL